MLTIGKLGVAFGGPKQLKSRPSELWRVCSLQESVLQEVGQMNWGAFKPKLTEAIITHLQPIQARYEEVMSDSAVLDQASCCLPLLSNPSIHSRSPFCAISNKADESCCTPWGKAYMICAAASRRSGRCK